MIDYQQFEYAAAPFTGAEWFARATQLAGLSSNVICQQAYGPFPEMAGKRLRVSTVCHPCDWLAYCYMETRRKYSSNHLGRFHALQYDTFRGFVGSYLAKMSGGVGELFGRYKADTVLRVEDLPAAFVELAESAGVARPLLQLCRKLRPPARPNMVWDDTLRKRVLSAERGLVLTYDYW